MLELEAAVDQLRLEKTDLSYRLKQELQRNGRAPDAGGPAASDTGSEVRLPITTHTILLRFCQLSGSVTPLRVLASTLVRGGFAATAWSPRPYSGFPVTACDPSYGAHSCADRVSPLVQRQAGNNATGQESPTSSAERVLTLSVPSGQERSLTGSDIKRMSWPEYTFLYEVRDVQPADSSFTKLFPKSFSSLILQRICAVLRPDAIVPFRFLCSLMFAGLFPVCTWVYPPLWRSSDGMRPHCRLIWRRWRPC